MPFNGTGTFTRIYSWQTDQANGVYVRADRMDTDSNDIATGLSNCITKDGQQTITANIPFANYKITGLGNGAASGDAVNFGQVFTNPTFTGGLTVSTGTVTMTGATSVLVPTASVGDNSTKAASTAFATALAFSAVLPNQATHADNVITTDGATASWTPNLKATVVRFKDGADATKLLAFSLTGITTGTTRTLTIPNKNGTIAVTGDTLQGFASAEQTITLAGALTLAHGLGSLPNMVFGYLKCVSTELNYSVGDVLCLPLGKSTNYAAGTDGWGISVVPDATNLVVRYASAGILVIDKTSGGGAAITPAKWTFSLRAYA